MADDENMEFDDIEGGMLDDEAMEALMGTPPEWKDKYEGKWYGKYRALVKSSTDLKKWGRIQVECPDIYGAGQLSPWVEPAGWMGLDSHSGSVWLPEIGAIVWVEFEEGNPDKPVWSYGPIFDSTTGLPQHAQGILDETDSGSTNPKGKGCLFIPVSSAAPTYTNWKGLKTPGGHMIEYDDTPGKERVQIFHKSGSHIEMLQDGSVHIAATKNVKIVSVNGQARMACMDTTCAALGNEVGMATTGGSYGPKGWLGQKTVATQPIVCGSILVQYLTALHGIINSISGGLATALGTAGGGLTSAGTNVAFVAAFPVAAGFLATAGGALTAGGVTMGTVAAALAALEALYFTPAPTSFLSDLWFTAKTVNPPEG